MNSAVEFLLFALLLSTASVAGAWLLAYRLVPEGQRPQLRHALLIWLGKGLLVPWAIWALMNLGLSWHLQPFLPQLQAARNSGGPWFAQYLRVAAVGLFVVGSFWTAVTLAWALVEAGVRTEGEPRAQFKGICNACAIGLAVPALLIVLFGGWALLGLAGIVLLAPTAHYAAGILHPKPLPPVYARAIARMKFGKYTEAEWEIIHELEKCEDDFEGWLMLADLYANQFHDLQEAERTILELCDHPKTTPSQLAVALHRLADWHLRHAGDPAAARRDLGAICDRLPGTHLAHMAQLRINQLPPTAAELRHPRSEAIPLPALGDSLDAKPAHADSDLEREQAIESARTCVKTLEQAPDSVPARERLARLLAEHLDQPEQAIEQVTLLLDMPDQPDSRRAEWLGLIAAWHLRYRQDVEAARGILQRLLRDFPASPQALAARYRLRSLDTAARK